MTCELGGNVLLICLPFIGQKTNEEREEDEAWNDKDNTNFLYDFGEKLKASSSFTPAMSHSSSV